MLTHKPDLKLPFNMKYLFGSREEKIILVNELKQ